MIIKQHTKHNVKGHRGTDPVCHSYQIRLSAYPTPDTDYQRVSVSLSACYPLFILHQIKEGDCAVCPSTMPERHRPKGSDNSPKAADENPKGAD